MKQRDELVQAIHNLCKRTQDSKELAESIAAYLLDTRQSKEIGRLLRELETVRLKQDGVLEAQVSSAHPLSEATKESIKALFAGEVREVIINEEQDPSLLGGVKVRAHDQQLDTSVRTRLQRLKAGV